jgi:hypothetical protein
MRPTYNVEPYYRVIILTTEQRPEKVRLPLQLRGSSGIKMGSGRLLWGPAAGVCRQYLSRSFSRSQRRYATVFQAYIYIYMQ